MVMGFSSHLLETLLQFPLDEHGDYKLHKSQCQALCKYSTSNLERLFGTIISPPPTDSTPHPLGTWKLLSALYERTLFKFKLSRKENGSSRDDSSFGYSLSSILKELQSMPHAIEELYRVIKEAQHFLQECSNAEWWRDIVLACTDMQVQDVHIHDLMLCIAGLKLSLNSARGVEVESRARFTRLAIAQCYAEMNDLSMLDSQLTKARDIDHQHLLSELRQLKVRFDGMSSVRKKIMNAQEKLKHDTVQFLWQKKEQNENYSVGKGLHNIYIQMQELTFPSQPCLIGKGRGGSVFEASWLGMRVAARRFDFNTHRYFFYHGIAALLQLQHPFLIQIFGWSHDASQGLGYIISELLTNNLTSHLTERSRLKKHPLRLPVLVDLMLQVARGIEYMHSKNIAHQNLKPSNIFVKPLSSCKELMEEGYGRVKLCDFDCEDPSCTSENIVYMAPEVLAREIRVDGENIAHLRQVDVYSFAMIFAFALTGHQPFAEIKSRTILQDMFMKGVRPGLPSSCPAFLKDLITKCWSKDPPLRPSFSSITLALRQFKLLIMKSNSIERLLGSLGEKEAFLCTPVISYQELSVATHQFKRRYPNVSMDNIHQGVLSDGLDMLVQERRSFLEETDIWNEVVQLFNLRHSNVASLQAVCTHGSNCWYIYKCIGIQGSLDRWLASDCQMQKPLDAEACYRVIQGVACGLQYLHLQGMLCTVSVESILLNEQFEPQILVDASLCKQRVGSLVHEQALDVKSFGNFLTQLLLYLGKYDGLVSEVRLRTAYISMLGDVQGFCLNSEDAKMDEVVEMLESHDECHPYSLKEDLSELISGTLDKEVVSSNINSLSYAGVRSDSLYMEYPNEVDSSREVGSCYMSGLFDS